MARQGRHGIAPGLRPVDPISETHVALRDESGPRYQEVAGIEASDRSGVLGLRPCQTVSNGTVVVGRRCRFVRPFLTLERMSPVG